MLGCLQPAFFYSVDFPTGHPRLAARCLQRNISGTRICGFVSRGMFRSRGDAFVLEADPEFRNSWNNTLLATEGKNEGSDDRTCTAVGKGLISGANTLDVKFCSKTRVQRKTKAGRLVSDVSHHELESFFHLPEHHACKQLGIGLTVFKRICRRFNIGRWPYRKVQRLQMLLKKIEAGLGSTADFLNLKTVMNDLKASLPLTSWKAVGARLNLKALPERSMKQQMKQVLSQCITATPLPSGSTSGTTAFQEGLQAVDGLPPLHAPTFDLCTPNFIPPDVLPSIANFDARTNSAFLNLFANHAEEQGLDFSRFSPSAQDFLPSAQCVAHASDEYLQDSRLPQGSQLDNKFSSLKYSSQWEQALKRSMDISHNYEFNETVLRRQVDPLWQYPSVPSSLHPLFSTISAELDGFRTPILQNNFLHESHPPVTNDDYGLPMAPEQRVSMHAGWSGRQLGEQNVHSSFPYEKCFGHAVLSRNPSEGAALLQQTMSRAVPSRLLDGLNFDGSGNVDAEVLGLGELRLIASPDECHMTSSQCDRHQPVYTTSSLSKCQRPAHQEKLDPCDLFHAQNLSIYRDLRRL